jgi:hypothetical protein
MIDTEPSAPVVVVSRESMTQTDAPNIEVESSRKDSAVVEIALQERQNKLSDISERKDSIVSSVSSTTSRRRRSPIDPFFRLRKNSDRNVLEKLPPGYPLEDVAQIPTESQHATPVPLHTIHTTSPQPTTLSLFLHNLLHIFFLLLACYCIHIRNKLLAWENANGVGFGEGYGNVNDRYGSLGNGHVLLGLLPVNLLSADSWMPEKAVNFITSTVSAFEEWAGLIPTPLY